MNAMDHEVEVRGRGLHTKVMTKDLRAAHKRLQDWNNGDDAVPPDYTHDGLLFQHDLNAVLHAVRF